MSFLEREVLFLVFALKLRFMLAQRYNSLPVREHFQSENVHYININHTFKVKTMNEISLSKIVVYSFHIPKLKFRIFFQVFFKI